MTAVVYFVSALLTGGGRVGEERVKRFRYPNSW